MSQIIRDFLKVGTLRLVARVLMGLRGLIIVTGLAPYALGEYTIWLLVIFYFSMLDFGVLSGLERDLPHFEGAGETQTRQRAADTGWSTFFLLSGAASITLGIVSYVVFQKAALAVLLGAYLFTDKHYRAYNAHARIKLLYQDSGIAELINAVVSVVLILALLPVWGAYGAMAGFVVAAVGSAGYLFFRTKLGFRWSFNLRDSIACVRGALSLAAIVYSIQFYHMVALTVLAVTTDKTTLGYFAFAFRIFYILLTLFPFLIQEVMRTRMYFQSARQRQGNPYFETLFFPMSIYCLFTTFFWVFLYWWADWGISTIAPQYIVASEPLKILSLALLPLGILKICSDYLCSNVHRKNMDVLVFWLAAIAIQAVLVFFLSADQSNVLTGIPVVYLLSTLAVYLAVSRLALNTEGETFPANLRLISLWVPQIMVVIVVYFLERLLHWSPSTDCPANILPFLTTILLVAAAMHMIKVRYGQSPHFSAFFNPRS